MVTPIDKWSAYVACACACAYVASEDQALGIKQYLGCGTRKAWTQSKVKQPYLTSVTRNSNSTDKPEANGAHFTPFFPLVLRFTGI